MKGVTPSLEPEKELLANGKPLPFVGIDEAGRGPLAGPVVAAAVQLPLDFLLKSGKVPQEWCFLEKLRDSKKITPRRREELFEILTSKEHHPSLFWGVGEASAEEIGELNILKATHLAMQRALEALLVASGRRRTQGHLLIDGLPVAGMPWEQTALVKGDGRSWSVAAASIIAKVIRDRKMEVIDQEYPQYGFAKHRGYGTALHLSNLKNYGPCPYHRRGFAPVDQAS